MDNWLITCHLKVYLTNIFHQVHLTSSLFSFLPSSVHSFISFSHSFTTVFFFLPITLESFPLDYITNIFSLRWESEKKSKTNNRQRERTAFLIDHHSEATSVVRGKSPFKNAPIWFQISYLRSRLRQTNLTVYTVNPLF